MKKRLNIFLLAFPLCPVFQIQAQEKPNLVFIMADQWRGNALGCLGKEPVKTPCLDQLAREGVNFTNAVSSYPVSSPARGMLMTGMYPHKNKVTGNCNSANAPYGVELPQDAITQYPPFEHRFPIPLTDGQTEYPVQPHIIYQHTGFLITRFP